MKTYTIIGGVNGTGKSSLTGVLAAEVSDLGHILDVDKLNAQYGGDVLAGGKAAVKAIKEYIAAGVCFTQETTLSGHKTAKTARLALENGYHVRLYYVGLDTAEESLKRIKNRVTKGGHDIPADDVLKRYASRFGDVAAVLPYCHEAVFYDNDNGFRVVAEYKNGTLHTVGETIPLWIQQLKAYLE